MKFLTTWLSALVFLAVLITGLFLAYVLASALADWAAHTFSSPVAQIAVCGSASIVALSFLMALGKFIEVQTDDSN